jgi:predicted ribosome quality control (RQC) complex YloA/Tae2 family protein
MMNRAVVAYEIDRHMIQYYRDLEAQVKAIQDASLAGGQIQKIYSTAFFISLSVRIPGKTWSLFLGRGSGMEGVWLDDVIPPSQLRRKDNFLEYLRRHLSSCTFIGLTLDQHDRIVKLDYQKFGMKQSLLLFWKARKVYFVHAYRESPEAQMKLLMSWKNRPVIPSEEISDLFSCFDEIGRRQDMKQDYSPSRKTSIRDLLLAEEESASLKAGIFKPGFLERKKLKIEEDLTRARQWEKIQDVLNNEESLENMYELKVGDHRIKFEGELNPYERRNLLFEKIKKLKKGETILSERLGTVNRTLEEKVKPVKTSTTLPVTKIAWGEEAGTIVKENPKAEPEDYKVIRASNCEIGVGKSARGNDQLRSKWAGKEDLWLHLDGLKSAHVIIKMPSGFPGNDEINLAASILAHFSHFRDEWIPVIYTQVKNLKGVSGVAGMVTYKKEKHLRCHMVDISSFIGIA